MKYFAASAILGSAFLGSAAAQIKVHSYLQSEPLLDDVYQVHMSVQDPVGSPPRIVCKGGGAEFFSSDKTAVDLTYANGGCNDPLWGVYSTFNTREVVVFRKSSRNHLIFCAFR